MEEIFANKVLKEPLIWASTSSLSWSDVSHLIHSLFKFQPWHLIVDLRSVCLIFPVDPAEAVEIDLAARTDLLINLGLWSLALTSGAFRSDCSAFWPCPVPRPCSAASTNPSSLLQNFVHRDKWVNRLQGKGLGHVPEPQQVNEQLLQVDREGNGPPTLYQCCSCYLCFTCDCTLSAHTECPGSVVS